MTLTRVVGKGRVQEMTRADLEAVLRGSARAVVDVGTGDGKYAYAVATAHPDWSVVGIDALDAPMEETAHRALRKPARGGRPNLVLLRASIEAVPAELHGMFDEIIVMLPWGRLLEGIVLGDARVVRGLASLARRNARYEITLNGEIWADSTPAKFAHLPDATPEHIATVVARAFDAAGIAIGPARWLAAGDAHAIHSTWAKKLGDGRTHPRFLRFVGVGNT